MFNIETAEGNITYGDNIVKTIVTRGVESLGDKAFLYNYSKKLPGFVPGFTLKVNFNKLNMSSATLSNAIKIKYDEEDGLYIRVYLIVKFGASINYITESLIDYIYEYTEKIMSIRPKKVSVSVTGVVSKNLVRRDIEVSR
ncbi:MAG: Asp23/Gls24 family envelope stress response protein [Bacillota bacterium]|nr:Asp23/Gls24 family envelope stress response protein [Bacillota bacterium]